MTMSKSGFNDIRLLISGLIGVAFVSIIAARLAPTPSPPPLSVRSDEAQGSMALSLWLEQSGFQVRQVLSKPLQLDDISVLFVLDPIVRYNDTEVRRIADWVRRGNRLIIAGSPFIVNSVLDAFDVRLSDYISDAGAQSLTSPTLTSPPFDSLQLGSAYEIESGQDNLVVHLAVDGRPVLASMQAGFGTVWISGSVRPFTNRGLGDEASAALILNLLAGISTFDVIGFDEAHHGFVTTPQSLRDWLLGTAPGWGIITLFVLTAAFLGLRGRRFGRPVPLPENRVRREPVEYIQAIANLYRRSGQKTFILRHYHTQLRRALTERYLIDPRVSDERLVKAITRREPDADVETLRRLLKDFSLQNISETELLSITREAESWMRRLH